MTGLFFAQLVFQGWATDAIYINTIGVTPPAIPGTIDALAFWNRAPFYETMNPGPTPYSTYNTLNYTNENTMMSYFGWRFDTSPSGPGVNRMAQNFINVSGSQIMARTMIDVWSSNIVNRGTMQIGDTNGFAYGNTFLSLRGNKVDLSRSIVRIGGNTSGYVSSAGVFDNYWGVGTNMGVPFLRSYTNIDTNTGMPYVMYSSPMHEVTRLISYGYQPYSAEVFLMQPTNRWAFRKTGDTNFTATYVFLANRDTNIQAQIGFQPSGDWWVPMVTWIAVNQDPMTRTNSTNYLHLEDRFALLTNVTMVTNFDSGSHLATFRPTNYVLYAYNWGYSGDPGLALTNAALSNLNAHLSGDGDWTAYSAMLRPEADRADLRVSVTNLPGKIEISADDTLNLNLARIQAENYLLLQATNHFLGSVGACITAPYTDIRLGSTNGVMAITNLVQAIPRWLGQVMMWSGLETNNYDFDGDGQEDEVLSHILMVDSPLAGHAPSTLNDLSLRVVGASSGLNSILLSEVLNIQHSLSLSAECVTVASNAEVNLLSAGMIWSNGVSRLQYLTNYGRIVGVDAMLLQQYDCLVNDGLVSGLTATLGANSIENNGIVFASSGPITVQAGVGRFGSGTLLAATNSGITISGNSLVFSNAMLAAARKLTITASDALRDAGTLATNIWVCGNGLDLLVKPATGDLLGTTVTNMASPLGNPINTWAGEDRGPDCSGFTNNVALGRLVLDGGDTSLFTFRAAGATNALYVDYLELRNNATNYFGANAGLEIEPNFTIYFANANGPVSKLDGAQGGRLRWVRNYAGPNSSITVPLRTGGSLVVNKALAQNPTLDSDGDGIPNASDAFPFDGPTIRPAITGSPAAQVNLSWNAAANTSYTVDYTTNLVSWQTLTNVTTGSSAGPVSVQDAVSVSSPRFYRISYAPWSVLP